METPDTTDAVGEPSDTAGPSPAAETADAAEPTAVPDVVDDPPASDEPAADSDPAAPDEPVADSDLPGADEPGRTDESPEVAEPPASGSAQEAGPAEVTDSGTAGDAAPTGSSESDADEAAAEPAPATTGTAAEPAPATGTAPESGAELPQPGEVPAWSASSVPPDGSPVGDPGSSETVEAPPPTGSGSAGAEAPGGTAPDAGPAEAELPENAPAAAEPARSEPDGSEPWTPPAGGGDAPIGTGAPAYSDDATQIIRLPDFDASPEPSDASPAPADEPADASPIPPGATAGDDGDDAADQPGADTPTGASSHPQVPGADGDVDWPRWPLPEPSATQAASTGPDTATDTEPDTVADAEPATGRDTDGDGQTAPDAPPQAQPTSAEDAPAASAAPATGGTDQDATQLIPIVAPVDRAEPVPPDTGRGIGTAPAPAASAAPVGTDDEPTTLMRADDEPTASIASDDEPTALMQAGDEPTMLMTPPAVPVAEEPTAVHTAVTPTVEQPPPSGAAPAGPVVPYQPPIAPQPVGRQLGPPTGPVPPQRLAVPAPVPAQPAPPLPGRRRSRAALLAVLAGALGLVLAGGALVVFRPGPVGRLFARVEASPSPSPRPPEPSPVLRAVGGAPAPTPGGVARTLTPLLDNPGLGDHTAVSVVDVATHSSLFAATPGAMETPASVTKLVTASAVLHARGPAYRIPTRVVAGRKPGEVVLVGGGDVLLATNDHSAYPGAARLDKLADQVKRALHGKKPTKVLVDSSLFTGPRRGPGWDDDIIPGGDSAPIAPVMLNAGRVDPNGESSARSSEPDLAVGRRLAAMLGLSGRDVRRGTAARHAKQLGAVRSAPLVRIIEQMLQRSDNTIAEAMARQVALTRGKPASFAGGAAATTAELAGMGLDTSGLKLSDGSGLSRKDRISPQFLTSLLVAVSSGRHPSLWPILTGMPVAGYSGTLSHRYTTGKEALVAGLVRAKTGSLSGTSTLAGLLVDRDGRLLAFAMMAEGIASNYTADLALDSLATALADCGCRS